MVASVSPILALQTPHRSPILGTVPGPSRVPSPLVTHAAASALVSGFCSAVLLQPFDFVKTRLQVASHARGRVAPAGSSLVALVARSVREEGAQVLWRGTLPSVLRVVPGVTLYFTTLTAAQHFLLPSGRNPKALEAATLAFGARCFAAVCLVPVTVVKTHFESGVHDKMSIGKTFTSVYRKAGVRGLYSGMWPTLARDAPFSALYYMFYSEMKKKTMTVTERSELPPTHLFLCGCLASVLATLITQPADVLKTRRQVYPWERVSYAFIVKDIYQNEGIPGLFRGVLPRILRRAGMASLSWTLFDTLKQRL